MSRHFDNKCFSCERVAFEKEFKRCARCKAALYCNAECQKRDWAAHKKYCKPSTVWYDKYRGCKDKTMHQGELELVTWTGIEVNTGMKLGWGAGWVEDGEDREKVFREEYQRNEERFFESCPGAFRWTCCGIVGYSKLGCEHHGDKRFPNSQPCTCDFCVMGKPLPDSIFHEKSIWRHGLKLSRGPDPRSYNPAMGIMAAASRSAMGLAM